MNSFIKVTGIDNEVLYINPSFIQYLASKKEGDSNINAIRLQEDTLIYIKDDIESLVKPKIQDNFYIWNSYYG